ncbi:MAG TPA: MotA/TolQ/ExbB proton channel family protein [Planctomycetota bacterium]|nr:MotA/TolQ/ExbB proton channel family protein [Planctomycetota bacterium]
MRKTLLLIAIIAVLTLSITKTFAGEGAAAPKSEAKAAASSTDKKDAPAAEGQTTRQMTLWELIKNSGSVGWIIVILSFVGLALVIENIVTLRRDKLLPPYFVAELEDLFENEQYEEALQLCETEDNLLSRIVSAGLAKVDKGYDAMEESMSEAAEQSALVLHQKLSYLTLIYSIAPMLGLLGTVVGMVISFSILAEKAGVANASDLAGGISMALITTVEGLVVAIPLMGAYHYFRNKVMRIDLETGAVAGDLMRRFKPSQKAAS